jgi:hypothetical protein
MKRRREQERDEAIAREQADARREALLADLRARQAGERPSTEPEPAPEPPADEAAGAESAEEPAQDSADASAEALPGD